MNATKSPRVRKPKTLLPVQGSARWVILPGIAHTLHPGVLEIKATRQDGKVVVEVYGVVENRDGAILAGYRLRKLDGTVYDLPADCSACDCPDATQNEGRPGGCKHRKDLAAALAVL
jgi:hypothetical protein